jgi:hypothetical protein
VARCRGSRAEPAFGDRERGVVQELTCVSRHRVGREVPQSVASFQYASRTPSGSVVYGERGRSRSRLPKYANVRIFNVSDNLIRAGDTRQHRGDAVRERPVPQMGLLTERFAENNREFSKKKGPDGGRHLGAGCSKDPDATFS